MVFKSDKYQLNKKNLANGLDLLANVNDKSITTAFFDPQYRGILDKLKYGNEGKSRGRERSSLDQMSEDIIIDFIKEINRVLKDKALYPSLAAECVSKVDTDRVNPNASNSLDWRCPDCNGIYGAVISLRVKGNSCPYCDNRQALKGYNDLTTTHPQLAEEWSPNNERSIHTVLKSLTTPYLWVCPACKGEYSYSVAEREIGDSSCPYCDGRQALKGYNDLATTHPELSKEWSPNNDRSVYAVLKSLTTPYLWVCPICNGEYSCSVSLREVGDKACPYCNNRKPLSGYNSFKVVHPDLMNEWLEVENLLIGVDADNHLPTSSQQAWWQCPICNYKYTMSFADRSMKKKRGHNPCPKCNGRRQSRLHYM